MNTDRSGIRDEITLTLDRARADMDVLGIGGLVEIVLTRPRRKAAGLEVVHFDRVLNIVTETGDSYYAERAAAGIAGSPLSALPAQVTGMRLGTGTTAPNKAAGTNMTIQTYLTASNIAIDTTNGGYPKSSQVGGTGTARRIQWRSIWGAGVATNSAITEAVITNETPLTNVGGAAGNCISRTTFTAVNKQSGDTLTITWNHDLLGA